MTNEATPMTPERRQELRALCEKATPGPWRWQPDDDSWFPCLVSDSDGVPGNVIWADEVEGGAGVFALHKDTAFIAASRQALPDLLSEVDRLTAEVERLGKVAEQAVGLAMMQIVEPERGAEAWVQAYRNCTGADRLPELAAYLEVKQ